MSRTNLLVGLDLRVKRGAALHFEVHCIHAATGTAGRASWAGAAYVALAISAASRLKSRRAYTKPYAGK
jgi:hypothetical protein